MRTRELDHGGDSLRFTTAKVHLHSDSLSPLGIIVIGNIMLWNGYGNRLPYDIEALLSMREWGRKFGINVRTTRRFVVLFVIYPVSPRP